MASTIFFGPAVIPKMIARGHCLNEHNCVKLKVKWKNAGNDVVSFRIEAGKP